MSKVPTCVRRIQFCAGHRVMDHESKCQNMHGHNYVVFFHARALWLDSIGRVIDFSVLKEKMGGWIDTYWDHGFIYYLEDDEMATMFGFEEGGHQKYKNFGLPYNPTAENMAKYLLEVTASLQMEGTGVEVFKVVLWETENCYAEAEL